MAASTVSPNRLYLGNLPHDITKDDILEHFGTHEAGNITEVKIMTGFGFIEYDDPMDARDVVPAFHGSDLKGKRLTVQFARGNRPREYPPQEHRARPTPRRTQFRMQLSNLAEGTSWQDLKDFARSGGLDVVYSEVSRERDGRGFVEYESQADLKQAVEKLQGEEFKGQAVKCVNDEQPEPLPSYRNRSRSPPRRGGYGYGPPPDPYYDRRPPPRGYSPRREDYRRRTPPGHRDDYYARERYRSPPRGARGPPPDDGYPPPRGYRDDPYGAPPPRRYEDPYANGYDRPPPRRSPPPGRYGGGGGGGYDERPRYW